MCSWLMLQGHFVCACVFAQSDYNRAFARPELSLAQRVADAMVSASVALMFGSGIPLLYPIALGVFVTTLVVDRLMRLCTVTYRYHKRLPELMIGGQSGT